MEIRKQKLVPVFFLATIFILASNLAAAQPIKLEKYIPMDLFADNLSSIEFCLYDAQFQGNKITCQTFGPGQWTADRNISIWDSFTNSEKLMARIKVDNFTNLSGITPNDQDLWVGVKLGGIGQGNIRESIEVPARSGMSILSVNADDVPNKVITPQSVTITGVGKVIDQNGGWVGEPTDIQGEKGDQGDPGADGPKGLTGDKGAKGMTGTKGLKGDRGVQGDQGLKGDTGVAGPPIATVALCVNALTNRGCRDYCEKNVIVDVSAPSYCQVTSNSGSCDANPGVKLGENAVCCVCSP